MAVPIGTVAGGEWSEFHRRAAVLGLPQIPDDTVVSSYSELIAGRDHHVLLLGITRALAALGCNLTALDKSAMQIQRMWPGDDRSRRAVLGDWRNMQRPSFLYSAAIGDGCLSTLEWPGEYRDVLARVADALEPGGRLVIRCFIAPEGPESLEQIVADVLARRETDVHATRWRVAMAAADANGAISSSDLAATWRRVFPPLPELAAWTGWGLADMELLMDSFGRAKLHYSFVTRAAVVQTLPPRLVNARFVPSGDYPLAERCPFLVAEREA